MNIEYNFTPSFQAVTVLFWTMTLCAREYGVEADPMSAMLELPPYVNHGWVSQCIQM